MQIIISPAKTLDFETASPTNERSNALFLNDSCELIDQLKTLSPDKISTLMKISPKLAELNYGRFQNWLMPFDPELSKQCLFAFKGDVYTGLDADTLNKKEIRYAQKHLRILSGLYGLLKPLDEILPYRLEMGSKFANGRGTDLYQFWGDKLTNALNAELRKDKNACLINLASKEYAKVLQISELDAEIITPVFKDMKNGKYKIISFYAKKARGMMSRFIISNQLKQVEDLKDFDRGGYVFNPELSSEKDWVFTRAEAV